MGLCRKTFSAYQQRCNIDRRAGRFIVLASGAAAQHLKNVSSSTKLESQTLLGG